MNKWMKTIERGKKKNRKLNPNQSSERVRYDWFAWMYPFLLNI